MKTSSTWNFRSIVGKIMLGLVVAAMIGSADVVPSFGADNHSRGENKAAAVTSKEGVGMTAAAVSTAGVSIALMATGKEFMSRRRLSMHRLRHRVSASFFHLSLFAPDGGLRAGCPVLTRKVKLCRSYVESDQRTAQQIFHGALNERTIYAYKNRYVKGLYIGQP